MIVIDYCYLVVMVWTGIGYQSFSSKLKILQIEYKNETVSYKRVWTSMALVWGSWGLSSSITLLEQFGARFSSSRQEEQREYEILWCNSIGNFVPIDLDLVPSVYNNNLFIYSI